MRAITLLAVLAAVAPAVAVEMRLTPRSINEAIAIGQSRVDRDRSRFHQPYRLMVNRAPLDYLDVVTPFRRIVLVAQSRAQVGDRSFGQRQALEMLDDFPVVELWLEFTFHPLNTFVGVPEYGVALEMPGRRHAPVGIERHPRHGARVDGSPLPLPVPGGLTLPDAAQPLTGGTVVARFDGRELSPDGTYDVIVDEKGKELARARVALGTLR